MSLAFQPSAPPSAAASNYHVPDVFFRQQPPMDPNHQLHRIELSVDKLCLQILSNELMKPEDVIIRGYYPVKDKEPKQLFLPTLLSLPIKDGSNGFFDKVGYVVFGAIEGFAKTFFSTFCNILDPTYDSAKKQLDSIFEDKIEYAQNAHLMGLLTLKEKIVNSVAQAALENAFCRVIINLSAIVVVLSAVEVSSPLLIVAGLISGTIAAGTLLYNASYDKTDDRNIEEANKYFRANSNRL